MDAWMIDDNACRHCRRPIQKLEHIGWVHAELAQYAHEALTCSKAEPVDARCPFCQQLTPGQAISADFKRLANHGVPTCSGSGSVQPIPS